MLRNSVVGGWVSAFPEKKRYEGVRFNAISVTRGWVGVKFLGNKRYVTLEWPLNGVVKDYSIALGMQHYRCSAESFLVTSKQAFNKI